MTEVLYRKYRSKGFNEVVGQKHIVSILKRQIEKKEIVHAYLFSGPRGTGKTTIARILAKEVNSVGENEDIGIDTIEIDAASNRGIDEIRDLKEKVNFVPAKGKYKVYIIDEVHMLTKEAFNALLKTIEEPPEHVIFIFATTEPHKIPITILSRVMRFDFKLANNDELKQKLEYILKSEKIKLDEEGLNIVIRNARGSFRDAESILEKVIKGGKSKNISRIDVEEALGMTSKEIVDNFLSAINGGDLRTALNELNRAYAEGKGIVQFVYQILDEAREILVDVVENKRSDWKLNNIAKLIKEFSGAIVAAKSNMIEILPFEISTINLIEGTEYQPNRTEPKEVNKVIKQNKKKETDNSAHKSVGKIEEPIIKEVKTDNKKEETAVYDEIDFSTEDFDIKMIIEKWPSFIEATKDVNHHLTAVLVKAHPKSITEEGLIIHVPYTFHKKKLEEVKIKQILSQVIKSIWNKDIPYIIKLDKTLLPPKNKAEKEASQDNENIVEEVFGI